VYSFILHNFNIIKDILLSVTIFFMANLSIAFLISKVYYGSIAYPILMALAMGKQWVSNAIKEDPPNT